jgi:hypothetical protein
MPVTNNLAALSDALCALRRVILNPKSRRTREEEENLNVCNDDGSFIYHRSAKVLTLLRGNIYSPRAIDISDPSLPLPLRAKLAKLGRVLDGYEFGPLHVAWRGDGRPELLLFLDEVIKALGLARPSAPTRDYCLLPSYMVRWIGPPRKIPPLLWHLLDLVLDTDGDSLDLEKAYEEAWGGKPRSLKTVRNTLGKLNDVLLDIGIKDWCLGVRGGHIVRKQL